MYSKDNPPTWASKKSKAVQAVAINVFNQTMKDTGSEEKARIASLAAMANAEKEFKDRAKSRVKKSFDEEVSSKLEEILKAKYQ